MPHQIYKTSDGRRVPSVTGISKPDCGALIYWSNQQGLNGITLEEARQATASPGSMTHERVDCFIKKKDWNPEKWLPQFDTVKLYNEAVEKAQRAFEAFEKWASFSKFQLVAGEIALVSEKHRFGGCLDAVMTSKGLAMADWKTGASGAIYADFLFQLAAYSILWEENFPERPITAGYHVIRFNRESADFAHWHFSELDDARKGFLLMRELYDINKRVKKRVS